MSRKLWFLVLSKKPRGKVRVDIVSDSYVPVKGEVVQILSSHDVKGVMGATRAHYGDAALKKRWDWGGLLDPVDPHTSR